MVEIDGADHSLERVGNHDGLGCGASFAAADTEEMGIVESFAGVIDGFGLDESGAVVSENTLGFGEVLVKIVGDNELENSVTEELKAFVVLGAAAFVFVDVATMSEGGDDVAWLFEGEAEPILGEGLVVVDGLRGELFAGDAGWDGFWFRHFGS